jgi:hypothetical protein
MSQLPQDSQVDIIFAPLTREIETLKLELSGEMKALSGLLDITLSTVRSLRKALEDLIKEVGSDKLIDGSAAFQRAVSLLGKL